MAAIYDSNDLLWTFRGDLFVGHNGDILDTFYDPLRSIVQEIRTRLQADLGDWSLYPGIGAQLSDFVGEPNNKTVAEAIKTRVVSSLTKFGMINSSDIKIIYAPIDLDKIMFRLTLSVAPTPANAGSETLNFNLIYSYSENHTYISTGV